MKTNTKILLSIIIAVLYSVLSFLFDWHSFNEFLFFPFADLFLRLLQVIALPLVITSLLVGAYDLFSMKKKNSMLKMFLMTIALYLGTTTIATTLGITNMSLFHRPSETFKEQNSNPEVSVIKYQEMAKQKKSDEKSFLNTMVEFFPKNIFSSLGSSQNIIQVITFVLMLAWGFSLVQYDRVEPFMAHIRLLNDVFIQLIDKLMQYAGPFIFALVVKGAHSLTAIPKDQLSQVINDLLLYSLIIIVTLLLMAFVVYPLMYLTFSRRRRNIASIYKKLGTVMGSAFATSSSAATIGISMEVLQDELSVDKHATSFVLPMGATLNMDGTALYQSAVIVFLFQFFGVPLAFDQILTIIFTVVMASIGTAAIPSAGLVMLLIIGESIGMKAHWIAMILPFDRVLDMLRTAVNVCGDCFVTLVIDERFFDKEN